MVCVESPGTGIPHEISLDGLETLMSSRPSLIKDTVSFLRDSGKIFNSPDSTAFLTAWPYFESLKNNFLLQLFRALRRGRRICRQPDLFGSQKPRAQRNKARYNFSCKYLRILQASSKV